jgi:hypothetical protein
MCKAPNSKGTYANVQTDFVKLFLSGQGADFAAVSAGEHLQRNSHE